ncbi:MAG: RDD family protein [Exilibacterium sp.]
MIDCQCFNNCVSRYRRRSWFPEGIDLHAELAGPIPRILAYTVDIFIRLIALTTVSATLSFMGKAGTGVILVLSFLAEWFYPVIFEVLNKGQTPGKLTLGLAVVNDDLTPISWGTSVLRNLLRAADFLPFILAD